jgi:hypothetical protein
MKIRKAADYMREIKGSFLFTGEVLGQRPMSQHRRAIDIIDKESGIAGLILRPLSARLFSPTVPEKEGWVNRELLLAITGRSRKPQIELALKEGINDYRCAAGGCLLTDPNFALRIKDYLDSVDNPLCADIPLLKVGRHFKLENGDRIVVARDDREGLGLLRLRQNGSTILAPLNFSAPVVLLQGSDKAYALQKMKEYTKRKIAEDALIQVVDDTSDTTFLFSEFSRILK